MERSRWHRARGRVAIGRFTRECNVGLARRSMFDLPWHHRLRLSQGSRRELRCLKSRRGQAPRVKNPFGRRPWQPLRTALHPPPRRTALSQSPTFRDRRAVRRSATPPVESAARLAGLARHAQQGLLGTVGLPLRRRRADRWLSRLCSPSSARTRHAIDIPRRHGNVYGAQHRPAELSPACEVRGESEVHKAVIDGASRRLVASRPARPTARAGDAALGV